MPLIRTQENKYVITNFTAWLPATVLPLFRLLGPQAMQISTDYTAVLLNKSLGSLVT